MKNQNFKRVVSLTVIVIETRVVVWGQYISSSVGLKRFNKEVSGIIKLPKFQQSVFTGLILSDG